MLQLRNWSSEDFPKLPGLHSLIALTALLHATLSGTSNSSSLFCMPPPPSLSCQQPWIYLAGSTVAAPALAEALTGPTAGLLVCLSAARPPPSSFHSVDEKWVINVLRSFQRPIPQVRWNLNSAARKAEKAFAHLLLLLTITSCYS